MSSINPVVSVNNINDFKKIMRDSSGTKKVPVIEKNCYLGAYLGIAPQDPEHSQIYYIAAGPAYKFDILTDLLPDDREPEYLKIFRERRDAFPAQLGKAAPFLLDPQTKSPPPLDIVAMFEQWSDGLKYFSFPKTFCDEVSSKDQIPMVTWEPSGLPHDLQAPDKTYLDLFNEQLEAGKNDPDYKGEIYAYAKKWADDAKAYGKPFFLRPFHEMNLMNQYPWTGYENGGPEKFIRAWKNLYDLFKKEGADNATFVWCPDATESYELGQFFPGNESVDWVGLDEYRRGIGTFEGIFGSSLSFMQNSGKDPNGPVKMPIIICETSSTPDEGKSEFIRQLFLGAGKYNISGIVWFNENKKGMGANETNWLVDAAFNDKTNNAQTVPVPVFPKQKEKLENKIRKIESSSYMAHTNPALDMSAAWLKLSEYYERLSAYATGKDEQAKAKFRMSYYYKAISALKNVDILRRNYVKAVDQTKNLDMALITELTEMPQNDKKDNKDKKGNEAQVLQAKLKCQELLDRVKPDSPYLKTNAFESWASSYKTFYKIFRRLDRVRFGKLEQFGYQASAYVTAAEIDLNLGNIKNANNIVVTDNIKTAKGLYAKARGILKDDVFARSQWAMDLDNYCMNIRDQKMPYGWLAVAKIWAIEHLVPDFFDIKFDPDFPFILVHSITDKQRDINNNISLGEARLLCVSDKLDDVKNGIKALETLAYSTGVNEDTKNKAKFYLMRAILAMNSLIEKPDEYKYAKDRELDALKNELAHTSYGGRAAGLVNDVAKNIEGRLK